MLKHTGISGKSLMWGAIQLSHDGMQLMLGSYARGREQLTFELTYSDGACEKTLIFPAEGC